MKKFFKVTVLASAVSLLAACGQEAQADKSADVKAYSEDQQAAYAIGSIVARNLVTPLKRQEELGAALKQGDVITAKRCAHRTIGSVRLYGSDRLETMLFEIGNKSLDVINTEAFQQELSAEFDSVISNVNTWLLKHS